MYLHGNTSITIISYIIASKVKISIGVGLVVKVMVEARTWPGHMLIACSQLYVDEAHL